MAILNFPNSGLAANVTQYTGDNGITYTWDGVKWIVQSAGIVGTISYTDLTNKPTIPTSFSKLVSGSAEVVLITEGPEPFTVFPAISTNDQLQIVGSEVGAVSGVLTLTSQTDTLILSNGAAFGGLKAWTFGSDGALTIPGDIKSDGNINIEINIGDSTLRRWQFGEDGALTFPDGTNQTTAGGSVSSLVNGVHQLELVVNGATPYVNFPAVNGGNVIIQGNQIGVEGSGAASRANLTSAESDVILSANSAVTPKNWTFGTDGSLRIPGDITSNGNINIEVNLTDSTLHRWQFGEDGALTLPSVGKINNGAYDWTFGADGSLTLPATGSLSAGSIYFNGSLHTGSQTQYQFEAIVYEGGPSPVYHSKLSLPNIAEIFAGEELSLSTWGSELAVKVRNPSDFSDHTWSFGNDGSLQIPGDIKSNGNINIDINLSDSTLRRWQFGEDGDLILPAGGDIKNSNGNSVLGSLVNGTETFTLSAAGNATFSGETGGSDRGIVWDYGAVAGGVNSRIRQDEDGLTVRAYTENGGNYAAPVRILTNQGDNERIWQFNGAGNLTLPGNITLPNGSVIKDTDYVAVAFGLGAGTISQGFYAVAVGSGAGYNGQGNAAVAIGSDAGGTSQGLNAVAVGGQAGSNNQGANAVAIGIQAGYTNQGANSIIINATGATLNQTTANTFTVKPVRQDETADAMYYNSSTGEITYADAFSFSVAADDSTQRLVSNNESIKFIGAGTVTTASDAEGNITITGSGGGTSIPTVVTTGAVGVDGAAHCKVQFTVTSSTEVTAVGVTAIGVSDPSKGTVTLSGSPATGSFDLVVVTNTTPGDTYILIPFATNASGTGYGAPGLGAGTTPCLVRGTLITMADMSRVAVENITYNDDILVWDFDLGEFASAKPIWIKKTQTAVVSCLLTFSDHSELRIVGESPKAHRIFNKEAGKFTYGSMPETPIGTTTFNDQGEEITLISKEWIVGEVEFYNVMTDYHMNLFANSILTSMRYNNVYPITDMKFVKDSRTLRTADDYPNVEERLYKGFRLAEQTQSVEEIETHIQWLLTLEVERETECV